MVKRYPSLSPTASAPGIRSAACGPGPPLVGGPNSASVVANLWNWDMYWTCMVLMVCTSRITAISLAFMRALPSLGTAIARMIRMIAITIRSSISEKPRARRRLQSCSMTIIMTRNLARAWKAICKGYVLGPAREDCEYLSYLNSWLLALAGLADQFYRIIPFWSV